VQSPCLAGSDLSGAGLINADLSGANLVGADLTGALLGATDFSNAKFGWTNLGDLDLSNALGLDTVEHTSPSTVGVDTLFRSKGTIPEAFLRGCGVPDALIAYLPSLLGSMQPIQFYSCFLSHSSADKEFARRLHSRMQQEGLRVWFDEVDMQSGKKIHEQIVDAIRLYDRLLLVLSRKSISSEWVKTELRRAFRLEREEGKRKLFPIALVPFSALKKWECFDSDLGMDLAVKVREYFIPPDFSNWKDHDAFEAGFTRLLKDLKDEGPPMK